MPDTGYLIAAVATAVAATWALRALPFAALAPLRSSPLAVYLKKALPAGVMVVLAVHTQRDFDPHVPDRAWPTAAALAFTLTLHLWRRNIPLSVLSGTLVHVLLAGAVFG
ncbi:branched-chain amino acid transporter permease [Streptomyces sp. CA-181903]|uniref:branched-chain amino acid transporter permease n=1 Tax=Streptomyces sp. CA-181903 TaxID=3240055 RepID=UPI003D8D96F9